MLDVPVAVIAYLLNFMINKCSLAYVLVDKDGFLSACGGHLSVYGVTNLQEGKKVAQQIFFLEGLLPLNDFPLFLPCIRTEYGICADIHIFPSQEGDWVLLLDATWNEIHVGMVQQQVNNLSLLQEKSTKMNQ
ncbi:hypothetical protein [Mastigocladopsis repens]|uniref:hypothetical protein n=1 Tax=Mastigocladopsis repens TaxID=221287 RepID=UPI0002E03662|nr:hypothetical protein [Mastigocladopsis repens]